jgi:integrase
MRAWSLTGGPFKKLLKRAELPERTRFHDLRHTCATLLLSQGVHPKFVQELLGHSTISTTIQKYKTASAADSRSANRDRHATARVGQRLRRLLCNYSDQETRQMTDGPAEPVV